MSIVGLFDSDLHIYRADQSITDGYGDTTITPTRVTTTRGSLQVHMRRNRERDDGAGDRPTGMAQLYYDKRSGLQEMDVVFIATGPNANTWWTAFSLFVPTRSRSHAECMLQAYVGAKPSDNSGI